jgi:hypothetical protein
MAPLTRMSARSGTPGLGSLLGPRAVTVIWEVDRPSVLSTSGEARTWRDSPSSDGPVAVGMSGLDVQAVGAHRAATARSRSEERRAVIMAAPGLLGIRPVGEVDAE